MSVETTSSLRAKKGGSRRYFKLRSYPRFGTGPFSAVKPPEAVLSSPYYWWFMYLKLNKEYKQTCDDKGEGKFAELYQDLGDVFSMDFKQWWSQDKITDLFAEPVTSYKMLVARSQEDLVPFDSDEAINLVVPLNWSRRSIQKQFTAIISKRVEAGKRGISHEYTDAKYKVTTRWNIQSFKNAYSVYTAKQAATLAGKKLSWADLGIKAGQGRIYGLNEGDRPARKSSDYADKRRVLSITVQQQHKRALGFIAAAASCGFPKAAK